MLICVVDGIYAIPVYKMVQRVLMLATAGSYILTIRGYSLIRVSIWYSCLCSVVLLSCFWCISKILDAAGMGKTLKIQFQEKDVRKKRLLSTTITLQSDKGTREHNHLIQRSAKKLILLKEKNNCVLQKILLLLFPNVKLNVKNIRIFKKALKIFILNTRELRIVKA